MHEWDDIGMRRGGREWGGNGMESPFHSSIDDEYHERDV